MHLGGYEGGGSPIKMQASALFTQFMQWLRDTNHKDTTWNATNFGRHMGEYVLKSSGGIVKGTDSAKRAVYSFHREPLAKFLKSKGMLIGRGIEWLGR